jgi:hypothetical protein
VEVNGMGNIDDGIEDREGKIEDMVDFLCRVFAKIYFEVGIEMAKVSKVGFEVVIEIPKVAKARVFSNYLEIFVHNLETVHKDIASYWVDEAAIVLLELHNKVTLVLYLLHYHSGKLPSTLVMMGNLQ